ncbi:phage holin family protein [Methylobacterium sp. J-059]|uniref:phage holin family protein n=1 Tax=Methylobacterium sp. J-059 TaxID=2836643 RepID=UPI001FBBAA8B|nr:phage holin family protein [Methylobacterium sp. J-059]MCJ2037393.1 phage holin family protein [Methylobacterium sp. J-059]
MPEWVCEGCYACAIAGTKSEQACQMVSLLVDFSRREALRGAGDVVRGEIALLRHEMAANLRSLIIGLAAMAGAAVFVVVGFLVLVDALVKSLANVVS